MANNHEVSTRKEFCIFYPICKIGNVYQYLHYIFPSAANYLVLARLHVSRHIKYLMRIAHPASHFTLQYYHEQIRHAFSRLAILRYTLQGITRTSLSCKMWSVCFDVLITAELETFRFIRHMYFGCHRRSKFLS